MTGHVVIAPDKFKGSLTAAEAAEALSAGLKRSDPALVTVLRPVADGGDGTLDTVLAAGFERVAVYGKGPTGQVVQTAYARSGGTAVVEMAEICGLQRLPGGERAPMTASSYGLGAVVAQALEHGCRDIIIGVGGSASTDGGAGLLAALGAIARDRNGERIDPSGQGIGDAETLDLTGLHPGIASATFTLASDVDNPLCGPLGAASVYAPQKGATAEQVEELDRSLRRWAEVVERETGSVYSSAAGAGAAGGVGFAALAVLRAKMQPGIDVIIDRIELDRQLSGARAVVTGEGSLDRQSLRGKAAVGVCRRAAAHRVPTFAVAGVSALTADEAIGAGFAGVYALSDLEPDQAQSMARAAELLTAVGEQLGRSLTAP
ncbi:glycerate kinase [Mycobacterium sp. ACS1612]|uniref:glycerate kinase n=1 Tax=Mycobacterium sp. ACS1612 TaxID=1834117 RepID=UPI0007FE836D|nr:glycerate kinase [Mycobacterium sp. ACS1612]OBF29412.1 glycerate kinase [Mycobacterium sp. ACS1612]